MTSAQLTAEAKRIAIDLSERMDEFASIQNRGMTLEAMSPQEGNRYIQSRQPRCAALAHEIAAMWSRLADLLDEANARLSESRS